MPAGPILGKPRTSDQAQILITKDAVIPKELRIVGYPKIQWVLNLSRAEVDMLCDIKIIPRYRNEDGDLVPGRFDILDVVQAVIMEERNKKGRLASIKTLVGKMDLAKLQKLETMTEREVIHNEMMKGTIVRLEDVDAEVIDMLLALRSKLLGFPSHVARLILGKEDFDEVCAILTQHMEEAMHDLKPPDPDAIRARNRKLTKYTDAMENSSDEVATLPDSDFSSANPNPLGRPRKDASNS
jgi:hypothetical protein